MEDFYPNIPEIIVSAIIMEEPNTPIPIYEGDFILRQNDSEIELNGIIKYDWFPSSGVTFSGIVKPNSTKILESSNDNIPFEILIDKLLFGKCLLTRYVMSVNVSLEGALIQTAIKGDKSIPVTKISFSIPNLKDFLGLPVKQVYDRRMQLNKSRLQFENDDYIITIDKHIDYSNKVKLLSSKGGYLLLYSGELTRKKGILTLDNSNDLFNCFSTFLSFLNGRRISSLFKQGIFEKNIIWTDYTDYSVDQYKAVHCWPQAHSIQGLNELWNCFSLMWKNEDDRNFLVSAIHWYIEANSHSGLTEGSIIMAQTGLELIYNWLLIENKKLIIGKDAENISASNKIRLLLSQINVSNDIPKSLSKLQTLPDIIDAPDAFVQIRNAIVHSQEEKRKKLTKMHYRIKYEALQMGIWYLELLLLNILKYQGIYINRCSSEINFINKHEYVPWVNKKLNKVT